MTKVMNSYDFQNQVRDLTDVLSTVIQRSCNVLQLFTVRPDAIQRKHEWLEDQITGKQCKVTDTVSDGACPMNSSDLAKLRVGTLVTIGNDSAIFRVTALDASTSKATVQLVGANGSAKTTPAKDDVLVVVSTPEAEGSTEGTKFSHQSGTNHNYTQIFRKDIILTGTANAITTYGIENRMNYQTRLALQEFARDMNLTALKGFPVAPTESVNGAAGGLFYFGTLGGGLLVDADDNTFDSFVVNDGGQAIAAEGGLPTVIICSPGQARVLSADSVNRVVQMREDELRGMVAVAVVNDTTGGRMNIFGDPAMPDDQAFIADPSGFGLVPLNGRAVSDRDTTLPGFDGFRRTAIGEYTFEFKNAKQRICRITGLKNSALALAEKRSGITKVEITNPPTEEPDED